MAWLRPDGDVRAYATGAAHGGAPPLGAARVRRAGRAARVDGRDRAGP